MVESQTGVPAWKRFAKKQPSNKVNKYFPSLVGPEFLSLIDNSVRFCQLECAIGTVLAFKRPQCLELRFATSERAIPITSTLPFVLGAYEPLAPHV